MSIVPSTDEGLVRIATPLDKFYEKQIDKITFRYAFYNGSYYLPVIDQYERFGFKYPHQYAHKFHNRYKSIFPKGFRLFEFKTAGGIQKILCATLDVITVLCSRIRDLTPTVIEYLQSYSKFQKELFEGNLALIPAERQAYLNTQLQGNYNFLSSEVKFFHKGLSALAQAVKQIQTQMDAKIDTKTNARIESYQVTVIHDLVQKELAVIVAEKRGLTKPTSPIYKECWLDFNKHFNIATYRHLPASQFEKAKKYLLYQIEKISKEEDSQ